jgi:hypothetical protein
LSSVYRHTQPGVVVVVTVGIAAVALAAGAYWGPLPRPVLLLAAALAVCVPVFGSLTVDIDSETLLVSFGPGLVRKRFQLSEIVSAEPVRFNGYDGCGIHRLQNGWGYSVSGLDAVEIEFSDGSAFRIGTDEPRALVASIRNARGLPAD